MASRLLVIAAVGAPVTAHTAAGALSATELTVFVNDETPTAHLEILFDRAKEEIIHHYATR